MTTVVVDTNVAVVANGDCVGCRPECRLAAIDFIERLIHSGSIAVDLTGEIENEYRRNVGAGTPGVGSRFLQKFFADSANRVVRVDIVNAAKNFPFNGSLRKFDQSDRKFVLVAIASRSRVVNAVDSDWIEHEVELNKRGVRIEFLCGKNRNDWIDR